MTPWALRNWLIEQPAPAVIRLTTEGQTQDMVPGKKSRVKLAETILSVGPELVECLDSSGNLLRAKRLEGEDRARSQEAPEIPRELVAANPEAAANAAMMSHFANLIHRAYEHATDIAFGKLVELVERMDERSASIEQRLERAEASYRREAQERIEDLWDRAEERENRSDAKEQILTSLVAGAVNGQGARRRPNGQKKPESGGDAS